MMQREKKTTQQNIDCTVRAHSGQHTFTVTVLNALKWTIVFVCVFALWIHYIIQRNKHWLSQIIVQFFVSSISNWHCRNVLQCANKSKWTHRFDASLSLSHAHTILLLLPFSIFILFISLTSLFRDETKPKQKSLLWDNHRDGIARIQTAIQNGKNANNRS